MITATCILIIAFFSNVTVFAASASSDVPYVEYSIEAGTDEALVNATMVSSTSYVENDRMITQKIYQQVDGTIITDTLDVSAIAPLSPNGSDTATRTRSISGWGTITITADFTWYTSGAFSYVKCTSMSAYHSLNSKVIVSKWDKSYTKDYVSIGKAKAQVEYYFCNSVNPTQFQDGTFKITCSDSGSISDNN